MLLVSVTTPTISMDLAACRIAKKLDPNILTVAKGAHLHAKDDEVLLAYPELDLVIRGESEHAIADIGEGKPWDSILGLAYREDGKTKRNPDRPYIEVENLDALPFPARHLLNNNLYTTPDTGEPITMVNTGRGCPHKCIYCAVTIASGFRLKVRSPKNIVDELEECVTKHNIRNFFFRADTFTWNEKWVVELCDMIVERGLKIRWGSEQPRRYHQREAARSHEARRLLDHRLRHRERQSRHARQDEEARQGRGRRKGGGDVQEVRHQELRPVRDRPAVGDARDGRRDDCLRQEDQAELSRLQHRLSVAGHGVLPHRQGDGTLQ